MQRVSAVGIAVVALSLLSARLGVALAGQTATELVGPTQQIARDGFKTWSLFLICTPDWVSPERSRDLASLYRRFKVFGDAIGNDNLAVWFWKRGTSLNDPKLSDNVDVARSAEYCRALQRPPSQGPYLLVTTAYPDLNAFPKDTAVFTLAGLQPADLGRLLDTLTDQLLLGRKVEAARDAAATTSSPAAPAPTSPDTASTSVWIQLLESARRTIIGLGCGVKMQINTGVLSAEVRGCPAS